MHNFRLIFCTQFSGLSRQNTTERQHVGKLHAMMLLTCSLLISYKAMIAPWTDLYKAMVMQHVLLHAKRQKHLLWASWFGEKRFCTTHRRNWATGWRTSWNWFTSFWLNWTSWGNADLMIFANELQLHQLKFWRASEAKGSRDPDLHQLVHRLLFGLLDSFCFSFGLGNKHAEICRNPLGKHKYRRTVSSNMLQEEFWHVLTTVLSDFTYLLMLRVELPGQLDEPGSWLSRRPDPRRASMTVATGQKRSQKPNSGESSLDTSRAAKSKTQLADEQSVLEVWRKSPKMRSSTGSSVLIPYAYPHVFQKAAIWCCKSIYVYGSYAKRAKRLRCFCLHGQLWKANLAMSLLSTSIGFARFTLYQQGLWPKKNRWMHL